MGHGGKPEREREKEIVCPTKPSPLSTDGEVSGINSVCEGQSPLGHLSYGSARIGVTQKAKQTFLSFISLLFTCFRTIHSRFT